MLTDLSLRRLARLTAWIALSLGALALAGWWRGIDGWRSISLFSIVVFGVLTFALRRLAHLEQRRREAESAREAEFGRLQQQTANLEALVSERTRELQQSNARLGTLAGGIAHDFNNLLTGILGYQDLALDSMAENDPARTYLNSAREASLRARVLVDQILAFSRQANREKVPVELGVVIDEACRFLRSTTPATIRIECDTSAACGRVQADVTQIYQVLLNLGSNAAHAMRTNGGTIRITLRQIKVDEKMASVFSHITVGPYARLDFSDTGHGMDDETRKRIFDPFFTTKEVGQGTGLGLSVVRGIVQAHRGAISVASAPREGATFTLLLPIVSAAADDAPAATDPLPPGNGELIAVVDDEDVVRNFAQMALEKSGYRVAAFDSPAQCLEVLRRNASDYRLLLADQTMPVMKGLELASELRAFAPRLPVVIMSGFFLRIPPETLAQIGHVTVICKPFTNEEIAQAVARALAPKSPTS